MGIYENTFWAHVKFETHSVIWAITSWNSHCTMYSKHGLLICTHVPWCILTDTCQLMSSLVDFDVAIWSWKPKSKHQQNLSLSGKSGQTTAPAWSENINLASHELTCAHVILKGRHSFHVGAWVRICFQRFAAWVSPTALRMMSFELRMGIPSSSEGMRPPGQQPNQARSYGSSAARVLFDSTGNGKFGRLKYVFFGFDLDDNHCIIHTHHAWPSQMHSNLLISGVKTRALINKFSCISEGQSWSVCITHCGLVMSYGDRDLGQHWLR